MAVHVPVKVEREYDRQRKFYTIKKVDSFGETCGKPYFTSVRSDALLSEAQMRQEIRDAQKCNRGR